MAITTMKAKDNSVLKQPATKGNVVNSIKAYNKKIQENYYDMDDVDAQEDKLQASIATLTKVLDKNNTVGTDFKNTSVTETDTDANKPWSSSGLIEKVNILGNLVGGGVSPNAWTRSTKANTVNTDGLTSSVPVIGTTKLDTEYTYKDNGLLEFYQQGYTGSVPSPEITGFDEDVSTKMILSEHQVVDLIKSVASQLTRNFGIQLATVNTEVTRTANNNANAYRGILSNINTIGVPSYWPVSVDCVSASADGAEYRFDLINGTQFPSATTGVSVESNGWVSTTYNYTTLSIAKATMPDELTELTDTLNTPDSSSISVKIPGTEATIVSHYEVSYVIYSDNNRSGDTDADSDDLADFTLYIPYGLYAPKLCGTDEWYTRTQDADTGDYEYTKFDFSQPIVSNKALYTRVYEGTEEDSDTTDTSDNTDGSTTSSSD